MFTVKLCLYYCCKFFKKIPGYNKNQAVNLQTKDEMMRQRVYCFLVVLLLMFSARIIAQKTPLVKNVFFPLTTVHLVEKDAMKVNSIYPGFYSEHLPFFCKKEWLFEKKTSIPLRLRLGSLDYTNYMERKPNALKQ
ncbi:MAG: hypothetical protein ACHQEB_06845 [Chitinophagales bacterium]